MQIDRRPTLAPEGPGFSQRLWRWLALAAGGIIALLAALSLLQCSLKKPESPTWDATLRLPVAQDHLSIANLLLRFPDGDELVDESGQIGLFWSDTLDTVMLVPDLSIPAQTASLPQALGRVTVQSPPDDSQRTLLSDFYAGPAGAIPALDVSDTDTLGPLPGYTWIAPGSGEAWIRVENQIGLPFDSVTVWLTDLASGPVGTFDFPGGIAAGHTDSLALGLAGRRFSNRFQYQLFAHTPGGTLFSLANRYLDLSIRFTDSLALDSGLLEVPRVVRSESEAIGFTGSSEVLSVRSALLVAGQLTFSVQNQTNLASAVTVAVPSFALAGVTLTRNLALQPRSTLVVSVDLAGYQWQPEEPRAPQYFMVHAVAATVPTAPQQVRIDRRDSVSVSAQLAGLVAQSATGVLAPKQVALPSLQKDLRVPSELAAFHAALATLTVDIENGSGAAASLHIGLGNDTGDSLDVAGPVAAGSPAAPRLSHLYHSNLAPLLDPYPTRVNVGGVATFGDSTTEFTLSRDDFACARVSVSAPLAVRIDTVTLGGDIERLDIEGKDVEDLVADLLSGTFHVDLGNHLPVGADLTFFVARDSATVFTAPDLVLGPVSVASGRTPISGVVNDTTRTVADLKLDRADLQLFAAGTLFVGYRVFLHGSAGQVVRFQTADYIDVTTHFDLVMRNGKEAW